MYSNWRWRRSARRIRRGKNCSTGQACVRSTKSTAYFKLGQISPICYNGGKMSAITYDQIAGLPVLRRFYHLAWKLFGVNIALVSPEGDRNVVLGSSDTISPFCTAVQRYPDLKRRCLSCDRNHFAAAHRTGQTLHYTCWAGLREFLIPIRIDVPTEHTTPVTPPIAFI